MDQDSSKQINKELYAPGEMIFTEGDEGYDFFVIEKGKVEIFKANADESRTVISEINPGEAFGEFALLDQDERSASARAVSETIVIRISQESYQTMVAQLPGWAVAMMRTFIKRLKIMNQQILEQEEQLHGKSAG